jgi:hypothetical protein
MSRPTVSVAARLAIGSLAAALAAGAAAPSAAAGAPVADAAPVSAAGGPAALSAEEEALLEKLASRAEQYRRYALGFTCEESVVRSFYNAEQGKFRRRDREVYDYLFERSEVSGRLGEVRELIEENGRPVRRSVRYLNLDVPPSYAWSQIFSRENRGRFHFKLAGKVLKGYRLLLQIDFTGWAAAPGKEEIAGWSGRASVDSGTLNLHTIEAEPSGQAARLAAERIKFQRAFAIMGIPLAARPRSRTLTVLFGFDHEGLTYPTETALVKSVYVSTAEQGVEERIVLRYRSYRFFKVGTQVEEARDRPLDPNAAPPPAPGASETPPPPPPEGEPAPGGDPNGPQHGPRNTPAAA